MTTSTTLPTTGRTVTAESPRHRLLTRLLAGAAPFDGAMGIACIAAASPIAGALGLRPVTVGVTGGLFLLAAVEGVWALRRPAAGVRWIVAANAVFGAWCLVALGVDSPNAWGATLLAASAVASGATAVAEQRLASAGRH